MLPVGHHHDDHVASGVDGRGDQAAAAQGFIVRVRGDDSKRTVRGKGGQLDCRRYRQSADSKPIVEEPAGCGRVPDADEAAGRSTDV